MERRFAIVSVRDLNVVHVQVVGAPTVANLQLYLGELTAAIRSVDRFAVIVNGVRADAFPAKYRGVLSSWMKTTQAEFEGRWVCCAFVISNRTLRGALLALFWLNKPYYPFVVVPNEAEAWKWTRERLAAPGASSAQAATDDDGGPP